MEDVDVDVNDLSNYSGGKQDAYGNSEAGCIGLGFGLSADACSNERTGAGACMGVGAGLFGF